MFWIIFAIFCFVLVFIGIILARFSYDLDLFGGAMAIFAGTALIILVILIPALSIQTHQSISVYEQQKEYIENHIPSDSIENAALTNKKIELNSWLLNEQYAKTHYGIFTFLPDEIMELKPIY